MTLLSKTYSILKKHSKDIAGFLVISGVVAGIRSCAVNLGEVVYQGTIQGKQVRYEEGRFSLGENDNFLCNVMTIKDGEKTYIFEDEKGERNIWNKKDVTKIYKDSLERVTIITPKGRIWYHPDTLFGPSIGTLEKRHEDEVMTESNRIYNDLRLVIRNKVQAKKEKEHSQRARSIGELL